MKNSSFTDLVIDSLVKLNELDKRRKNEKSVLKDKRERKDKNGKMRKIVSRSIFEKSQGSANAFSG